MANNPQAKKRIRQNATARLRNRFQIVSMRSAIKKLRGTQDKQEAEKLLTEVISLIDRNAKRDLFHKKRAGNLKSKLTRHVATL